MKRVKIICLWVVLVSVFYALEKLLALICPVHVYCPYILIFSFGIVIGLITRMNWFNKKSIFFQSMVSMIILIFTVVSVNASLMSIPILVTVVVKYGMLWFLLSPAAFWVEDIIRCKFWDEGEQYSLRFAYHELMNLGSRGRK